MKLKRGVSIIAGILLLSLSFGSECADLPEAPGYLKKSLLVEEDKDNDFGYIKKTYKEEKKPFGPSTVKPFRATDRVNPLGYHTVKEALEDLQKKPDVIVKRNDDHWTIITRQVGANEDIWLFPPYWHKAYPAAVRRTIFEED